MKLAILKTFLSAAFFIFCTSNIQAQDKVETVEVKVTGMMCSGCASKVFNVLQETTGVVDNEVKYPGEADIVKYDTEQTNPEKIVGAIEGGTDFEAKLKEES